MLNVLSRSPRLPASFYNRDPRRVARDLLGKVLIRREGREIRAGRIVEVEAYLGSHDSAAHAAAGLTARNRVLFGPPGRAYVYFIYGNHYCLNVSCLPEGDAGCVLLRALEPLAGIPAMSRARGLKTASAGLNELRLLSSGPGRLTQALGINRALDNGKNLTSRDSDLVIVDDGVARPRFKVTARIGIAKAAERKLRYFVTGNAFVSGRRK